MIPLIKTKLAGLTGKIGGVIKRIRAPTIVKGGIIAGTGYIGARGVTELGRTIRIAGEETREVIRDAGRDIRGFGVFFWIIIAIFSVIGILILLSNRKKVVKQVRRRVRRF